MTVRAVTRAERPELWDRIAGLSAEVWPEYNRHGDVLLRHWSRLYDELADFQFVLFDEEADDVLAAGHTIPCGWDGTPAGLGTGIDHVVVAGFALIESGRPANALSALSAEVPLRHRARGLSGAVLQA